MISAWAQQNELVFGQQAVPEAANETGTLPKLLQVLELEGAIVTVDAAGCFPDVTKTIIDQGADYVLTLKGNQGELYRDATRLFDRIRASARPSAAGHKTVDAGHDRVEVRRCWAMEVEGRGLIDTQRWTRLRTLCKVSAERHHPDGTVESEERLFISSLKADPKQLLRAVRAHWHVENKLHWTLDVAFAEDKSRVRTGAAAQNLAIVRRLALSLLKQETSRSEGIQTKRMEAAWNPDYLLKVLTVGH